jgi:D-amino-acid dehydrogenase
MKQLVIIGAGVVGLCAAYFARKAGFAVTVLERQSADYEGTSFGNAGMIVPSHFVPLAAPGIMSQGLRWMLDKESPFYVKPRLDADLLTWGYQFWQHSNQQHVDKAAPLLLELNLQSRDLYKEMAKELKPFGLEQKGLLMLCATEYGLEKEAKLAETSQQLGMKAKVLNRKEVERLEPNLDMNIVGGVHYPEDAHMNPKALMLALRDWLKTNAVTIIWNTDILGWHKAEKGIHTVKTSRADIACDALLIASGIWSLELLKSLGLKLSMQAGKGYSMLLNKPPQAFETPAILSEAKVAISPLGSAVRFGGTMEIAGLEPRVNPSRVEGIIKSVLNYFPAYQYEDFAQTSVWYGFRPCTPDGLPYLGKLAGYENLFLATGHAMMGLSLGPITGKRVTEMLTAEARAPELLNPNRFIQTYSGF